ncbi:hypothetical protein I7I51_05862 [Histoplasma capsulatum]|uniref:Uncharacterized protein n=1 Tax=Ajellomyces capsulatus TaxID=5037 RepID=A0A8A1M8W0_AJECA|nr:hypothetical protein I7I51_05862 [Histoplasma capsulatum]
MSVQPQQGGDGGAVRSISQNANSIGYWQLSPDCKKGSEWFDPLCFTGTILVSQKRMGGRLINTILAQHGIFWLDSIYIPRLINYSNRINSAGSSGLNSPKAGLSSHTLMSPFNNVCPPEVLICNRLQAAGQQQLLLDEPLRFDHHWACSCNGHVVGLFAALDPAQITTGDSIANCSTSKASTSSAASSRFPSTLSIMWTML